MSRTTSQISCRVSKILQSLINQTSRFSMQTRVPALTRSLQDVRRGQAWLHLLAIQVLRLVIQQLKGQSTCWCQKYKYVLIACRAIGLKLVFCRQVFETLIEGNVQRVKYRVLSMFVTTTYFSFACNNFKLASHARIRPHMLWNIFRHSSSKLLYQAPSITVQMYYDRTQPSLCSSNQ